MKIFINIFKFKYIKNKFTLNKFIIKNNFKISFLNLKF